MQEQFFIDLIKYVGFPGLLYLIWFFYHKSTMKIFESMIQNQFQTLKDLIETNQCTVAALARLEQKIDTNTFCPILRDKKKERTQNE